MSNIQDIREQLRAETGPKPGFFYLGRRIVAATAVCLAISGIIYSLFFRVTVVPLRPSASIPTFHRVNPDGTPEQSASAAQPNASRMEAPPDPARYAGLSPRQTGKVVDEVCFARAHARVPHWSKTPRLTTKELYEITFDDMPHFNELLNCLLTEAPARYCSSSQRSMITAEIAMYFRVMEYDKDSTAKYKAEVLAAQQSGRVTPDPDVFERIDQRKIVADPRVVSAIEARLRDGTLLASDREKFSGVAPPPLRQRFASVKTSTPACPAQPWWAFWRNL